MPNAPRAARREDSLPYAIKYNDEMTVKTLKGGKK